MPTITSVGPAGIAASCRIAGAGIASASPSWVARPAEPKPEEKPEETPEQQMALRRLETLLALTERLGITLEKVATENVERRRTFGGEMMVPAGRTIVVAADEGTAHGILKAAA